MLRMFPLIACALVAGESRAITTLTISNSKADSYSYWYAAGWGGNQGFPQGTKTGEISAVCSTGKSAKIVDGDQPATMNFVSPNPHDPFGKGTEKEPFLFDLALIGRQNPVFGVLGKLDGFDPVPDDKLVAGKWGVGAVTGVLLNDTTLRLRGFGYASILSDSLLKAVGEDPKWVKTDLGATLTVILTREGGFKLGERIEGKVTDISLEIQIPSPSALTVLGAGGAFAARRRGR